MRVVLVSGAKKNWNGGASSVFLYLDRELKLLGVNCTLFNSEDFDRGVPRWIAKLILAWVVRRRIYSAARSADVVEISGGLGWALFRRLRKLPVADRPLLVVRLHGLEYKDEQARISQHIARTLKLSPKYLWLNRHWIRFQEFQSIRLADVVAVHTSRELDGIVMCRLKDESRISVVPLGVDTKFHRPHEYRAKAIRVLWWGSWVERKGIADIPRAFALALAQCPDLHLTLGGTGKTMQELQTLFEPQCRDKIEVLPFMSSEAHLELLEKHDIFLFPSLSEGFGLALLEAMAAGLPCITTLTGMYDRLEHGRNCYIVPMNAPTAIAAALVTLSPNADLRRSIGQAASATARELTWGRFGAGVLADYQIRTKGE